MKSIVVGTAGHIDHGKTALIRALTGIDTDRLEEEKRRGISIDLGFAHLQLGEKYRIAFVDVPGHERFIKNMLAGAGGIDAVLLVISAEESIKLQTREHFDICRLLRIPTGLIAITKSDLASPDLAELVRLETIEWLRGSFLEGAPIVTVSAVTGSGLDELRQELSRLAECVPARKGSQYFRLPVDRAFSMRGFGSVATGVVVSGSISVDQDVEVQPGGQRTRVRGIQVHGSAAGGASAGQRAAVNLAGVEPADVPRGVVLCEPGRYQSTRVADCEFEPLPGTPPLKHGAPIHFHAGAAETVAEVRLLDASGRFLRLMLREPLLLLPGDRFVARKFSPLMTIGGGVILDCDPPRGPRRAAASQRALALKDATLESRVRLLAGEAQAGLGLSEMVRRTGAREEALLPFAALRQPQAWFFDSERIEKLRSDWKSQLAAHHRATPLSPGMAKEELRSRTFPGPPAIFDHLLTSTPEIAVTADTVRLRSHTVTLQDDESGAIAKIEKAFQDAGLPAPGIEEVLQTCGIEPKRARSLLQILLRDGRVMRISQDLILHRDAVKNLHALLAAKKGIRFSVGDFKEWAGVSRKYAIPLLEYLDRDRVTRREGDSRIVL